MDDVTFDGTCPWCGQTIEDLWNHASATQDGFGLDCPHCGRPIAGATDVVYRLERAGEDVEG